MAKRDTDMKSDIDYQPTFRSRLPVSTRSLSAQERAKFTELAKARALDDSVFEEEGKEPFFWTARASNETVDAYFTRMNENSLENYVRDATDPGVQFQNSHNIMHVGFGRSLGGKVVGRAGNKEALIDFYAIRGLSAGTMTSDQFIDGVRAGIYSDVSIGFTPGQMVCNICGNDKMRFLQDLFDEEKEVCRHWPGMEYEVGEGRSKKLVQCVLDVQNARLNEVSLVYDGATPGAGIAAVDMARMVSAEGKLGAVERQALENLYRVRIAPPPGVYGGVDLEARYSMGTSTATTDRAVAETEEPVEDPITEREVTETVIELEGERQPQPQESEEPLERLRRKYQERGLTIKADDPIRIIDSLAERVCSLYEKNKELERDATYGREAREALLVKLDETVVRAFGSEKADDRQAKYRRMVNGLDMDEVQSVIDELEERAVARIGKGGQLTKLKDESVVDDTPTPADRLPRRRGETPSHLVV